MTTSVTAGDRPSRRTPLAVVRETRAAWRRLVPFFRSSRKKTILLAVVSVVAGVVEAALLALVAVVATALSRGESAVTADLVVGELHADVPVMLGIGVGLALFRAGAQIVLAYLPASMSAQAMADLRRELFDAFTLGAWSVKASERDGQFQSLMNAHITSTAQAVITVASGVTAVIMFGTLLASAFVLSLPAAVVLTAASVILFLALRPLARRLRRHAKALSAENIEYSKGVQEVVLMAEETQVFGASQSYRDAFYALVAEVRIPLLRTRFLSGAVPAIYQSIALLMLVLALLAVSFVDPERIAALGAVVLLLIRAMTYGQQLQTAITNIDERVPFMNRLADAIDRYSSSPQQDGEQPLESVETMGLQDVRYSYVPGVEVLSGISFEATRGEAIGIVGPSGAGKSSIVQMLLRLRDPDGGTVRVNGQDVRGFRRRDWQKRVAYVPQSPQLIWGTVTQNIRFYRPWISDHDIEEAARRAHIHDEIMSWPDGYATVIGQRASAVSGGQRQRLCIARALADRPDVLVLDEPTSALDVKSEELVQESLHAVKGELILFLVAHRLSTLAMCNRVMVVVGGRVQAIDRPAALLRTNEFYREVTEITQRQNTM